MNSSKESAGDYHPVSSDPGLHLTATSGLEVASPGDPEAHTYYGAQTSEKAPSYSPGKEPERRKIAGVSPLIFWILIFTVVVLLAAGLGAGLGAGLSTKTTSKTIASQAPTSASPNTASHTPNPAEPAHSPSTSHPSTSSRVICPANDTLVYTPPSHTSSSTAYSVNATTLTYTIHCNKTYFPSSDIIDVQYIPNSNLSACIQACSLYNIQLPNGGGDDEFYDLCSGLTVTGDGVCELKTGVLNDAVGVNRTGGVGNSAKLMWFSDD